MISRLIDIEVPKEIQTRHSIKYTNPGNYTIQDYAASFVYGMGETQRNRFKEMLKNNIQCGISVAKSYGVDYTDFINNVKKLLKVEV